jgi:hypothetical protein
VAAAIQNGLDTRFYFVHYKLEASKEASLTSITGERPPLGASALAFAGGAALCGDPGSTILTTT